MGTKTDEGKRRRSSDDPIAEGLRRLWQNVESEPVPDSFLDLLDQIDDARTGDNTVSRAPNEGSAQ
jgi:hypothetical protein